MKLRFLGFIFLFLSALSVKAQKALNLSVSIFSATDDSLNNITVQIYQLPDTNLLNTKIFNGLPVNFSINKFSKYIIQISAVGFEIVAKMITITDKPVYAKLLIRRKSTELKKVVVVSKKPLIKQEDDKTIIDAEPLANTSTNVYEVLEKTPGTIVDQDGNIYLNSATPATIYINGREMKMSADDIASLLKSLPAGSISKIEILRTPSAKYDAANSGGIVNVVLKKGIRIGTRGSINFRQDQGVYATSSVGFSINQSQGKMNAYWSYQYTLRKSFEEISSDRLTSGDTLLKQISFTKYSPFTHYTGGGVDISFSKKFNLAYDFRFSSTQNNSQATSNNNFSKIVTGQLLSQLQTPISNTGPGLFINNTLLANYKIDSLGSEWTNEADYSFTKNNNTQWYTNYYLLPLNPSQIGDGTIHNTANFVNLKSDLTLKLKHKLTFESGYKLSNSVNDNNAEFFLKVGNSPRQVNSFQTNIFNFKETIHSAYLQFSRPLIGFIMKAGLRLENTNITGHQVIPKDTLFSIRRSDLFPYFYLKHNLFKIMGYPLNGNAIYRRSISRPGYDALNPLPKFVDQFLYDVGNPQLKSQFTTNYELNVSYNDFPVFAFGINETRNIFSKVTYQDKINNAAYRTYDNLGKNREIYIRLFGAIPQDRKYFLYAGMQYNFLNYNGFYQGLPLQYKRGSWTFFTGHEYKATPSLNFNLNAWMYVNGFRAFNELKTLGQLNISITKMVMAKKLSIILSGNDVLFTNKAEFHIQQGNLVGNGTRIQDSRRVGVTLRYNFGIRPKEEKKQNFEQPADSRDN